MAKTTNFLGTVSSDWTNPANWSNGEPGSGDTVGFTGGPAVTLTDLLITSESLSVGIRQSQTFNFVGDGLGPSGKTVFDSRTVFNASGVFENDGSITNLGSFSGTVSSDGAQAGIFDNEGTFTESENSGHALFSLTTLAGSTILNNGAIIFGQPSDTTVPLIATIGAISGSGTISIHPQGFQTSVEFTQGLTSNLKLSLYNGEYKLDANASGINTAASITFTTLLGTSGEAEIDFADISKTAENTRSTASLNMTRSPSAPTRSTH